MKVTPDERQLVVWLIETMEESVFIASQVPPRRFTEDHILRLLDNGDLDISMMNAASVEYALTDLRDPMWNLLNEAAISLADKIEQATK